MELHKTLRWGLRWGLRHRRLLAAVLAAGAVFAGAQAVAPPEPETATVLAAARDLAWGSALTDGDLRPLALPAAVVPDGALTDAAAVLGRVLAAPVRRGETLTDLRLLGPGLLGEDGSGDLVAAPVRIADPDAAALLRAGDVVDVLAAGREDSAEVVASAVRVLLVPAGADGGASVLAEGALVVLATTREVAASLARAATNSRLSVTLRVTSDE